MKTNRLLTATIAALLVAIPAATVAAAASRTRAVGEDKGAETAFREARGYTVRIRTRIETPFFGDDRGAFQGAGFLVDAERGWIVTNAHVVGRSPSDVEVAFAGQPFQRARKLYVDSFADIAIVTLDHPLPGVRAAPLDRTFAPVIGEAVGAFGHPLGVPYTGTRGIVSGRTDQFGPDLIQIDATVDHGNSGGPVIALRDRRILGIATAMTEGDRHDRLNFATPIEDVQLILKLLRSEVPPSPPRLPFALLKDEDDRHTLRVGATFDPVGWPLRPGDRIVSIEGEPDSLRNLNDLVRQLRGRTGPVSLLVERDDRREVIVTHPTSRQPVLDRRGISIDGALIAPIDFEDESNLAEPARLAIHSVEPASTAQTVSLGQLDILYSMDGRRFGDIDSLIDYVGSRPGQPLAIVVRRSSPDLYRVFDYHGRELPGSVIRIVREDEAPTIARR